MATVCNLCRKPAERRGNNIRMYRLILATACDEDFEFSLFFSDDISLTAMCSNYQSVICADCLRKLGVDKALDDDRRNRRLRPRPAQPAPPAPEGK